MTTVSKEGFRYSSKVFDRVVREARKHKIKKSDLFAAAKAADNGDGYLSAREFKQGMQSLMGRSGYERLMSLSTADFAEAARADVEAPPGARIPQVAALQFDRAKKVRGVEPSEAARHRDLVMDRVANRVADKINAKRHWSAKVLGGDEAKADVLGGVLPQKHSSESWRTFGEAYNLLEVHIPRVGDETLALTWQRSFNEWREDGKRYSYIEEEPTLFLGFVDPQSKSMLGSGRHLDEGDWDPFRWEPEPTASAKGLFETRDPRKLETLIEEAADIIVDELERFKSLNQ